MQLEILNGLVFCFHISYQLFCNSLNLNDFRPVSLDSSRWPVKDFPEPLFSHPKASNRLISKALTAQPTPQTHWSNWPPIVGNPGWFPPNRAAGASARSGGLNPGNGGHTVAGARHNQTIPVKPV